MDEQFAVRVRGGINDKMRDAIKSGLPRFSRALVEPEEDWDAAGRSFFRVRTKAESAEQAADAIRQVLADFKGLEVGPVEPIGFSGVGWAGRFEEIQHRAIEHYVAESFMAMSTEHNRIHRVAHGREDNYFRPLTANLEKSYPDTILEITVRSANGRTLKSKVAMWKDENFVKAVERNFEAVDLWIGELLFQTRHRIQPQQHAHEHDRPT